MEESREPQFHCSLTGEILDDPVWGADGRAYERHALEAFLAAGEDAAAAHLFFSLRISNEHQKAQRSSTTSNASSATHPTAKRQHW